MVVIKTKPSKDDRRHSQYNDLFRTSFPQLLHEVFGGELWIDGFKCYRSNRRLVKSFNGGQDGAAIPVTADEDVGGTV
jgi:hypothetical protein